MFALWKVNIFKHFLTWRWQLIILLIRDDDSWKYMDQKTYVYSILIYSGNAQFVPYEHELYSQKFCIVKIWVIWITGKILSINSIRRAEHIILPLCKYMAIAARICIFGMGSILHWLGVIWICVAVVNHRYNMAHYVIYYYAFIHFYTMLEWMAFAIAANVIITWSYLDIADRDSPQPWNICNI